MSRKRFEQMNCGVAQALEQIGDWWTLLIVRDALFGATRFQQFQKSLGIAKNILSDRLSKLVEHGIMEKQRLDEPGQRYAYRLTRKGRDLWLLLTAMRLWSDKWVFGDDRVPLKFQERGTRREVAGLIAVDADGVPIAAGDLEWTAGPGWRSEKPSPDALLPATQPEPHPPTRTGKRRGAQPSKRTR